MDNKINSILIVDDTPKNLQVLGNTLKLENFKVEFAINGFQALDWIKKKDFDLILLDVMMPEMDGYEVCEKIRANDKYKNLPIIFLTAKTDSESIVKGFEIGAQDYISKPFNTAELLIRVSTQLELKNSKTKLENMNEWLESEVKKRTNELKQAYEELEIVNQDLVGLDKAKSDFLTIISNEIRTPLNGIMGPLHILKNKIDSAEMINLVNVLDDSVNRLEKFTSYALLMTSLKTGKYEFKLEKIQIAQAIDIGLFELSELIKKHKIKITNNISDEIEFTIDNKLFVQSIIGIFQNLVSHSKVESDISINFDSEINKIEIECSGLKFSDNILKKELTDNIDQGSEFGVELNLAALIIRSMKGEITIQNKDNNANVLITLD